MRRRTRGTVIVLTILGGLAATEVVLNWARGPEAQVKIENLGDEPIDSLVVTHGTSRAAVPR
ncbi:MAG: hypothetical protein LC745_13625, partial [Planctomycetia bacterium]|nr:hypothetical protein [Planctomycetia bacterium]